MGQTSWSTVISSYNSSNVASIIITPIIARIINNSTYYCSVAPTDDLPVPCLLPGSAEINSLAVLGLGSM